MQPRNVERLSKLFGELEGLQQYDALSDMISAVLKQRLHGIPEYTIQTTRTAWKT